MCHSADERCLLCVHTSPHRARYVGEATQQLRREKGFAKFVREGLPKSRSASYATDLTSLVVLPNAREAFTPRELVAAYEDFVGGEPQYLDAERGIKASAYRFDTRALLVYEESETGSIVLIHPAS
jgi:hypothetical protein